MFTFASRNFALAIAYKWKRRTPCAQNSMSSELASVCEGEVELQATRRTARVAGFLYLIVVVTGIFSIAYVPSQLEVPGDGAATFSKIVASETLFRSGVVAGYVCYTAFLLLPLVLYKLLAPVSKQAAIYMAVLAIASVPISFVNLLHKVDIITLINRPVSLPPSVIHQEIAIALAAYSSGLLVSKIFWGLWLLPFGYLVFKSQFLPKILGLLLMAGCVGYVVGFLGGMLIPNYGSTVIAPYVPLPATLGEIGTCLWLLIVGVRVRAATSRS